MSQIKKKNTNGPFRAVAFNSCSKLTEQAQTRDGYRNKTNGT